MSNTLLTQAVVKGLKEIQPTELNTPRSIAGGWFVDLASFFGVASWNIVVRAFALPTSGYAAHLAGSKNNLCIK